jgi:hypothetical protein
MIARKLHLMWDAPENQWPPLVLLCIRLWQELNPDFEITLYDEKSVRNLIGHDIPDASYQRMKVQHRSDLVRTKLLATQGGIWVDATCLPHRPIREWIGHYDDCDFAGVKASSRGCIVDNWFMLSKPCSILMSEQYASLLKYWREPKIYLPQDEYSVDLISINWEKYIDNYASDVLKIAPYFLWHYLFTKKISERDDLARLLTAQKFLSTKGECGHLTMAISAASVCTPAMRSDVNAFIINTEAPLSKLIRHSSVTNILIPTLLTAVCNRNNLAYDKICVLAGVAAINAGPLAQMRIRAPGAEGLRVYFLDHAGSIGLGPVISEMGEKISPPGGTIFANLVHIGEIEHSGSRIVIGKAIDVSRGIDVVYSFDNPIKEFITIVLSSEYDTRIKFFQKKNGKFDEFSSRIVRARVSTDINLI